MRAAPQGNACQGDRVSGAGLVGPPHGPGGTRRARSTRARERLCGGQGCESLSLARWRGSDPV
jgi:hypothetical protein